MNDLNQNNELVIQNPNTSNKTHTQNNVNKSKSRKNLIIGIVIFSLIIFFCLGSCGILFILLSMGSTSNGITFQSNIENPNINRVKEETILKISARDGDNLRLTSSKIAVIDLRDVISYTTNPQDLFVGTNNRSVSLKIQKALSDESVKAVIIRFNTPGGAVDAAEPICREIKQLNNVKPVYAFIDSEGASLGYLLANCTKSIYSRPTAITGSIGVRVDILDIIGILENLGAKQTTITNTQGSKKTQDGLFTPGSDEYKQIQKILDEIYNYFIDTVWANRSINASNKLTKEKLISYSDGRIFSGKQAYELGLVDQLGEFDDVVKDIIEKEKLKDNINVVEYNLELDFFSSLFRMINTISPILGLQPVETKKVMFLLIAEY